MFSLLHKCIPTALTTFVIFILVSHSYGGNASSSTIARKSVKNSVSSYRKSDKRTGNEPMKQRASGAVGSKEFESLKDGKADIRRRTKLLSSNFSIELNKRKVPLLCATFLNASLPQTQNLLSNIQIMRECCDWAIIIYDDSELLSTKLCGNVTISPYLVHCKLATVLQNKKVHVTSFAHGNVVSIPKAVLYRELFPLLPFYDEVFLLDDDVSLSGGMFDPKKFLLAYRTAFGLNGPPLIAQPLLKDNPVMHNFLNYDYWQSSSGNGSSRSGTRAVAAKVLVVEPLVNIVQSAFFEWLVRRVLVHTREASLRLGVDWGLNRLWCKAAAAYSSLVLHHTTTSTTTTSTTPSTTPEVIDSADLDYNSYIQYTSNSNLSASNSTESGCAVIIAGGPVRHMNGVLTTNRSSGLAIKDTKNVFKRNAKMIIRRYLQLYPNWLSMVSTHEMDPLKESGRNMGLKIIYGNMEN